MEEKSSAVKREILMSLVQRYGNKPPKVLVSKAKERGLYHLSQSDDEIYTLMERFAKFHNLPFGYQEPPEVKEIMKLIVKENVDPIEEADPFYASLLKEHSILSKRILALNKLIETYKHE